MRTLTLRGCVTRWPVAPVNGLHLIGDQDPGDRLSCVSKPSMPSKIDRELCLAAGVVLRCVAPRRASLRRGRRGGGPAEPPTNGADLRLCGLSSPGRAVGDDGHRGWAMISVIQVPPLLQRVAAVAYLERHQSAASGALKVAGSACGVY